MANLASLVKRFDPGKMLGGAISSGVGRFRSNIGSGDKGYRVMMRGYSTIKSFERRFASRDSGKSRPAGPAGGPTRRAPSTSPSAPSGAPARANHIAAGEEFTHKGNVYIVPEGHVFDTRSGRLIADPALSKSRSFVSFAKAGVIMQSSFDNFKTVTFRKLDKIIDLVSKLQPSPVVAAPLEEAKKPEEVGAPEKEKPGNWLPFLAGMLSGLGLRYFVRPLVQLFKRIMKWITGLWTAVRKLFTRIANAIISAFKRFWQFMTKIKNAFLRVVNFVKNLIPKTWEALKNIGKRIGKFFTEKFTAAKDFIVKRLTAVKDYLIKLGARALVWLGKMLTQLLPASVIATLKGSRAGKAIDASKAAKGVSGTPGKIGPGGKLVAHLKKIPYVGPIITAVLIANDIQKADDDLANNIIDVPEHNKRVAKIVVGAIGMMAGSALFGFLGGMGGAVVGSVVPVFGTVIGGLVGGLVGQVAGGFAGERAFEEILNRSGGAEALGEAINAVLKAQSIPKDIPDATQIANQLESANTEQQFHELEKNVRSLHKNKFIDKAERDNIIRQIAARKTRPNNRPRDISSPVMMSGASGGMSGDLVPGAQIGERIAGDRVGPKAPPRVVGGDVTPPPVATPPSDSSPTTVQPVPPQTPPAPDEQRDEFGNIVVINSQTNITSKTNVNTGPAHQRGSTSPDPWQHIGL